MAAICKLVGNLAQEAILSHKRRVHRPFVPIPGTSLSPWSPSGLPSLLAPLAMLSDCWVNSPVPCSLNCGMPGWPALGLLKYWARRTGRCLDGAVHNVMWVGWLWPKICSTKPAVVRLSAVVLMSYKSTSLHACKCLRSFQCPENTQGQTGDHHQRTSLVPPSLTHFPSFPIRSLNTSWSPCGWLRKIAPRSARNSLGGEAADVLSRVEAPLLSHREGIKEDP